MGRFRSTHPFVLTCGVHSRQHVALSPIPTTLDEGSGQATERGDALPCIKYVGRSIGHYM